MDQDHKYQPSKTNADTMKKKPCLPIKMVVFDLDGTLLDEGRFISLRNQNAVRSLRDAGIEYTLASGRTELQMRIFAEQLDVRLPIIACNGAVIYDHRKDRDVFRKQMSQQLIDETLEYLFSQGNDFLCYTADCIYYPDYGRKIEVMRLYNQKAQERGSRLIKLEILDRQKLHTLTSGMVKILAIQDGCQDAQALMDIASRHEATVVASMADAIDIMAPDVSKGLGMAKLAQILGIDLETVVAFGDHDNDASMLAMAGIGIAMGHATDAALAAADMVAPPCENAGVATVIETFILPKCCV
jgi:Cof subfamily protein (haloacid dehalogenase superfamily)